MTQDFRKLEAEIEAFFKSEGIDVERIIGINDPFAGELVIHHDGDKINISALARWLADLK